MSPKAEFVLILVRTLGKFIRQYFFGRSAAIRRKFLCFFHEYNLFSVFVNLRILTVTIISTLVLRVPVFSLILSLSPCSIFPIGLLLFFASLSSLLPYFILLYYKLQGRDCFFFIFLAPKVSIRCFQKLSGGKGIQLNYSFFKPSSNTVIPDFSHIQPVLSFVFLNLSLWCIISYVASIHCFDCSIIVSFV